MANPVIRVFPETRFRVVYLKNKRVSNDFFAFVPFLCYITQDQRHRKDTALWRRQINSCFQM